ncbi:hypothetical protein KTI57_08370, partial [Acinetobacter pittii]|uniref:thioesterase domain-containing protein n=1 Tax=Acinetobacter pittii TaxID=48296 RepID=UPI0021D030A0
IEELKNALKDSLPPYMVPGTVILINEFPLTISGKVNLNDLTKITADEVYESKENESATKLENVVAKIWQQVLGLNKIDLDANYFSIGGNSIDTVRIVNQLKKKLEIEVPISTLYQNPTVTTFCKAITSQSTSELSSIILLKQGTSQNSLTIIHPIGGDVTCYRKLIDTLGDHLTVWGIQRPEFSFLENPKIWTVEQLAKLYVAQLKLKQPKGPYKLAGWSFGGVLAFEMTRQLESIGEVVDFLGLIDSHFLLPGREIVSNVDLNELKDSNLGSQDFDGGKVFGEIWSKLECHINNSITNASVDSQLSSFFRGIYLSNWLALSKYNAESIVSRITLFSATESESIVPLLERSAYISKLSTEKLNIHNIDGDHFSIVVGDDMPKLAKILSKEIELL